MTDHNTSAESAHTRNQANSSVTIPVTVELSADGDTFIAHAAGINYVASGAWGDEAKRNFARGLMATLAAHVERMREPSKLLDAASSSESPKGSFSIAGTITRVGNDEDGKPRIVVHTTREAITACAANLLGQSVEVALAAGNYPAKPDSSFSDAVPAIWYCVSKDGVASVCLSEANARKEAAENDKLWPSGAPHVAVQILPVGAQPAAVKDCLTTQQAADAKDAARYRWLRDKANFANRHAPAVVSCPLDDAMKSILCDKELDAAMDAAMSAGEQSNG